MVTDEYASGLGDYTVTVTADAPADTNGAYGEVTLAAAYKEVKVVPAAPSGFSATAGEVAGTVHLEWDASGSAIATGYRVLLDDGSAAGPQVVADGIAPDATSFDMSMLAEGTYTVALEAASEAGASAAATVANVTVAPYVPWPGGGPGGTAVHSASSGSLRTDGPNEAEQAYLGFAINFYGIRTDEIYVDEAGIVGVPLGNSDDLAYPWQSMADREAAVIAPWWSETNLEGDGVTSGGSVMYGATTWHDDATDKDFGAFHVTWADMWNSAAVGHESLYNTFELYLVNRADTGAGNFDIVFVYDDIEWSVRDGGTAEAETGYSRGLPDVSGSYKETGGPIRNPEYTLTVTDTVSGAGLSDTDNDPARPGGILGAVTDQNDGLGHLNIDVERTGGDDLEGPSWRLDWTAVDASPTPGSGSFTPTGSEDDVKVGPSANAWTVKVSNLHDPAFERDIKVFVATLQIKWNGTGDLIDVGGDGNHYSDPTASHYSNGTVISGLNHPINIYAGQKIALAAWINAPAGAELRLVRWDPGSLADLVKAYTPTPTSFQSGRVDYFSWSDMNAQEIVFYCPEDAPARVFAGKALLFVDGHPVNLRTTVSFNIHKPGQSIWSGAGPVANGPRLFQVDWTAYPGHSPDVNTLVGAEVAWSTSVPLPPAHYEGQVSWVQLVIGRQDVWKSSVLHWIASTDGEFMLDNNYPYKGKYGVVGDGDAPAVSAPNATTFFIDFAFNDWLMWTPPEGIAVPIQEFRWGASVWADWNTLTSSWDLQVFTPSGDREEGEGWDTSEYPTWDHVFHNNSMHLTVP